MQNFTFKDSEEENKITIYEYEWFEKNRSEQVSCVQNLEDVFLNGKNKVGLYAGIKSGKRTISIVFAMRNRNPGTKHIYTTSLNKLDCKNQINELEAYGFKCFIMANKEVVEECKNYILEQLNCNDTIYVHLDESDYGTDFKQLMNSVYSKFKNNSKIKFIFSSATNRELIAAYPEMDMVNFIPNKNYRDAEFFIKENLIYEAKPIIEFNKKDKQYKFSDQFESIIADFENQNEKPFCIVRLATKINGKSIFSLLKNSKDTAEYFIGKNINQEFIDANNSFDWCEDWKIFETKFKTAGTKTVLFINQTGTRSTEFNCHHLIFVLHDFRNKKTKYNTRIQAYGRMFHYDVIGCRIKIYANIGTFNKYIADQKNDLSLDTAPEIGWSSRVKEERSNDKYKYKYLSTVLKEGYTEEEFIAALKKDGLERFLTDDVHPQLKIKYNSVKRGFFSGRNNHNMWKDLKDNVVRSTDLTHSYAEYNFDAENKEGRYPESWEEIVKSNLVGSVFIAIKTEIFEKTQSVIAHNTMYN